jgi:hypothetical protein
MVAGADFMWSSKVPRYLPSKLCSIITEVLYECHEPPHQPRPRTLDTSWETGWWRSFLCECVDDISLGLYCAKLELKVKVEDWSFS